MSPAATPPLQNPDAERAAVGAALCPQPPDDRARLLELATPTDFYDQALGVLWDTITRLHQNGTDITPATVIGHADPTLAGQRINKTLVNQLFLAGTTHAAHTHARIVAHDAGRRRALLATYELATRIQDDAPWGDHLGQLAELHTRSLTGSDLGIIDLTNLDTDGPVPTLGEITPTFHLFYPAAIHDLHGEPSVGKTWIALWAAVEALHHNQGAMFIDYEDTAATCRSRLIDLGATIDDLARFRYVPGRAFTDADLHELRTVAAGLDGGPIIIDAVAPALAAEGLDENSNTDVSNWIVRLPRQLARTGSPTILLDHVGKQKQDRARGARGAGAKLAAIDGASYEITGQGFSRTQIGKVHVKVAKDRHGHVGAVGSIAADLQIAPGPDDEVIVTPSRPDSPITKDGRFRPTHLMAAISTWAHDQGPDFEFQISTVTPRDGDRPIPGRTDNIRGAVAALHAEGHLSRRAGRRAGEYHYRLERPFTDPDPESTRPSRAPRENTPEPDHAPHAPPRAPHHPSTRPHAPQTPSDTVGLHAPHAPAPLEGAERGAWNTDAHPTDDDDIF